MAKSKNWLILACIGVILLTAGYFGARYMAKNMAEQKVQEFFAGMDDVVHAEYGGVDVGLFSREAVVSDLRIAALGGKTIAMDRMVLSRYEEEDGVPRAVTVRFEGVDVPVTPEYFKESSEFIHKLGYDVLHCDYVMDYAYRKAEQTLDLAEFSLIVKDAGKLGFSVQLANVDLDDLAQGGPSAMLVAVDGIEVNYTDDSLMDRLMKTAAAEERMSEEQLMREANKNMEREIARTRDRGEEFAAQAMSELQRFVNERKGLRVSADPKQPVTVLEIIGMKNPQNVIEALGVEVRAQ
jgi:hypothetical protein